MNAQDKTIIVTGGGNGIGRALVMELLNRGAHIAAADINATALQETQQLAGSAAERLSTHVVDVTDKQAVEALVQEAQQHHGQLDGIINNAGIIQPFVRVNDLDFEAIERVLHINLYGQLYLIKAALPVLLERPAAHIVNVSSMGGFLPVPGQSVYGASKAAVKLLSEGLYAELKETPVRVSVVFPGGTSTNITENSGVETPAAAAEMQEKGSSIPTATPEEVARTIVNGMEKNKVRIYTGKDSKAMQLLYRLSPQFATNFIAKQMKSLLG